MYPWQINPTVSRDLVGPVSPERAQIRGGLALSATPDAPAVADRAGRRRKLRRWMAAALAKADRRSVGRTAAPPCEMPAHVC